MGLVRLVPLYTPRLTPGIALRISSATSCTVLPGATKDDIRLWLISVYAEPRTNCVTLSVPLLRVVISATLPANNLLIPISLYPHSNTAAG